MTTEEKAKAYAEKRTEDCVSEHYGSMMMRRRVERFDSYDIEQAYEDGATEALASQWKDSKVELPEDDSVVLAKIAETANEHEFIRYTVARYTDGCWIFQDEYFEDCMVSHWLRIPALPDGKEGEG